MDYKQTKKEIEKKAQAGDTLGAAMIALKYIRERGLDNGATLFAVGGIADYALREITHTGTKQNSPQAHGTIAGGRLYQRNKTLKGE